MKARFILTALILSFCLISFSQDKITVAGKVSDTNKKPVKGASVIADNVATGVKTDKKGNYSVTLPSDAKVIKILCRTGQSFEQQVNGRTEINFELPANFSKAEKAQPESELSQEEVNIGYGTVKKKDLATPVTKVNQPANQIPYKDIYEMLRGKPGVQVSGKSVRIQGGVNSFTMSSEPLFVLDGVVVNSIDDIVPQEVKSIEILKGSSAAIYGSRGANGVILITRKK